MSNASLDGLLLVVLGHLEPSFLGPRQDSALAGKTIQTYLFPHYYQLQPWLASGAVQVKNADLSDPNRRAEPKSIYLHFDSMTSANPHK